MENKVIFLLFVFGVVAVLAGTVVAENEEEAQAEVSVEAYVGSVKDNLESIETKINETMEEALELLNQKFNSTEQNIDTEKEKAKKEEKDREKFEKCLEELELNLKSEMKKDMETAEECFKDASDKAKKILEEARKTLANTFGGTSSLRRSARSAYDTLNEKVSEFNPTLQSALEALKTQKEETDECSDKFIDDLTQMGDAYITLINACKTA